MKVGYLPHAFDLLNVEHLDLLDQARMHCDRLLVGVLGDVDVQETTGRLPVVPFAERLELIKHVRVVDQAVPHYPRPAGLSYDVLFVLGGETIQDVPDGVEIQVLAPRRRSGSSVLARALHPTSGEAVA